MSSTTNVTNKYPPLPWTLKGAALLSVYVTDYDIARKFVPSNVKIIKILPNKTLSGIYYANYIEGSTLVYQELAIASALCAYEGKRGFWMSNVYVNEIHSLESGIPLWGWDKKLGKFLNANNSVDISCDDIDLLSIKYKTDKLSLKFPMSLSTFGINSEAIKWFKGSGRASMHLAKAKIDIPKESELTKFGLKRHLATFNAKDLSMIYRTVEDLPLR